MSIRRERVRFGTPLFVVEWMNGYVPYHQFVRLWGYRILILPKLWVAKPGYPIEFRWFIEREWKREIIEI